MVEEGFCLPRALGDAEGVGEELFDELEMWGGCESGVEGEDGAGAFEAVAREVEFGHCVYYIERPLARGLEDCSGAEERVQFCKCILTVGPLGALLIQI